MENLEVTIAKLQNLKLLYVEDDDILRISTMTIFEEFFEDIYISVDGKDGLDTYKSNEIDIIITDLNMPIMGGIEMIKEIRKTDNNIPILVFSAYNEESILNEIKGYNIQGYLYKPMELEEFINVISKII